MKKQLLAIIALGAVFASCQKSDIAPVQKQYTIELMTIGKVNVHTTDTGFIMLPFNPVLVAGDQLRIQNISHTDAEVKVNGHVWKFAPGEVIGHGAGRGVYNEN